MKVMKKISSLILSVCLLVGVWSNVAHAATGSLTVSSKTGTVGSTVTVSGTVSASEAISGVTVTLTYDPSGLQYVGGTPASDVSGGSGRVTYLGEAVGQNKSSLSFTMTFKILKEGSFRVSGVVDAYTDATMDKISIPGGGGTITGKAVTTNNPGSGNSGNSGTGNSGSGNTGSGNTGTGGQTTTPSQDDSKDKNSKLNNLLIHPGTMAPAFSAGTTSYTVEVPEDTTAVTISATAQSSKATVSVSGGKDLQPGENTAKVVVTAENGSVTVYNITIIRGEAEKEIIQVNGTDNTINEAFADDTIPEGFVREKITYNGKEYEALKHEKGDLQLVSLQNDVDGAVFYIYNEITQEFYNFVQVQISAEKNIIPLPLKEIQEFSNYELVVLTLQDKAFDAWKIDDEYSLLPFLNADGEEIIYQYDSVDGTLQRYAGPVSEVEVVEEEESEKPFWEEYSMYIIAGLGGLVIILFITLIYFIATRKHRHEARKRKAQKKLEKQNKAE